MTNHEWFDGEPNDGLEHITKLIVGDYSVSAVAVEPTAITNGTKHQLIRMGDNKSTMILVDRNYVSECLSLNTSEDGDNEDALEDAIHKVYEFGVFIGQLLSFEAAHLISINGDNLYE